MTEITDADRAMAERIRKQMSRRSTPAHMRPAATLNMPKGTSKRSKPKRRSIRAMSTGMRG